jgi:regulator of nonsense transcripts 2
MNGVSEEIITSGGKWEDEEEKRFYEEIQDLKDFVPSSVLGVDSAEAEEIEKNNRLQAERAKDEVKKLEEELENLGKENKTEQSSDEDHEEE